MARRTSLCAFRDGCASRAPHDIRCSPELLRGFAGDAHAQASAQSSASVPATGGCRLACAVDVHGTPALCWLVPDDGVEERDAILQPWLWDALARGQSASVLTVEVEHIPQHRISVCRNIALVRISGSLPVGVARTRRQDDDAGSAGKCQSLQPSGIDYAGAAVRRLAGVLVSESALVCLRWFGGAEVVFRVQSVTASADAHADTSADIDATPGHTRQRAVLRLAPSTGCEMYSATPPVPARVTSAARAAIAAIGDDVPSRGSRRPADALTLYVASALSSPSSDLRRRGGVLVVGPSGAGKTHLVGAVCAAFPVPLFRLSCVTLAARHASETATSASAVEDVRGLFAQCVGLSPCVVVLDDADAIGRGSSLWDCVGRSLDTLPLGACTVILAQSQEALPSSLFRPGRIDHVVSLRPPSSTERTAALVHVMREELALAASHSHANVFPHADHEADFDVAEIARRLTQSTAGFLPRDLVRLCRVAGLHLQSLLMSRMASPPSLRDDGDREESAAGFTEDDVSRAFDAALASVRPAQLQRYAPGDIGTATAVTWDDVGGYNDIKARLERVVMWPLLHGDALRRLGLPPSSGVLLHGPSGCGKTLLARGLSERARRSANAVWVRAPELFSKYLGESEAAVRDLFARVRESVPCIVVIDEIDAIAGSRDSLTDDGGGGDAATGGVGGRVLSQLLNEMEGVVSNTGAEGSVVVVGCTSMPLSAIDAAVLRPGRLENIIEVGLPTRVRENGAKCNRHALVDY
eukprot:Opistho-2@22828